jgi:hypothetical protein
MGSVSPYAKPFAGLEIREGGPLLKRSSRDELQKFPAEAKEIIEGIRREQSSQKNDFALDWMRKRNFLLCGATGYGLGACLAACVLDNIGPEGSLTIVSRDLKNSFNYHTALYLQETAAAKGVKFTWANTGLSSDDNGFKTLAGILRKQGRDFIYVNTVAHAFSGLLPGMAPVYVKDLDESGGLIQWKLQELSEKQVGVNREMMGGTSVAVPAALEREGLCADVSVFCDWRGTLDKISRVPDAAEYGRQGAYSTSLFLSKDIIQRYVMENPDRKGRIILDAFFPIMDTPALLFLPGGRLIRDLMKKIMEKNGQRPKPVSAVALELWHLVGHYIGRKMFNPFPRLDCYESQFDLPFFYLLERLNSDESSEFYYRKWI